MGEPDLAHEFNTGAQFTVRNTDFGYFSENCKFALEV
jgi:hypothetical protein